MKSCSFGAVLGAVFVSSLLSFSSIGRAADVTAPALQAGDLLAICGDSITEQKLYSVDIADYLLMCQPQANLSAVQFGWSGEKAPAFAARMKNDALVFKPTVATTCYGMNDGGYGPTTPVVTDTYRKAMTSIVDTFKANGVRSIVVGSPGAVDTYYYHRPAGSTGPNTEAKVYNQTLGDLTQVAREVAQQEGVGFADVHDTMLDVMTKAKAANGDDFPVAGKPDGVHPNPDGHVVMAYAFLKALGCDGNIATITVDMRSNVAEATDGTRVISDTNGSVELESTRYPFCFSGDPKDPRSTSSILPFLPFNQDLNRYMLVVKNAAGPMKVTWGGQAKTFSADDLTKGVNLAAEFLDNPFSAPFAAVQQKIKEQQAFETLGSKQLLHSLTQWQLVPETQDIMGPLIPQLADRIVTKWKGLRDASAAAVTPVKHEIRIEPAR